MIWSSPLENDDRELGERSNRRKRQRSVVGRLS